MLEVYDEQKEKKRLASNDSRPYDSEKTLQSGYALFAKEPSRQEIVQMQKSTEPQVEPETENLTVESEKPEWALRITAQERYYLAKIAMCEAEGGKAPLQKP